MVIDKCFGFGQEGANAKAPWVKLLNLSLGVNAEIGRIVLTMILKRRR